MVLSSDDSCVVCTLVNLPPDTLIYEGYKTYKAKIFHHCWNEIEDKYSR